MAYPHAGNRIEAELKYQQARREVMDLLEQEIAQLIGVDGLRLSDIDEDALVAADAWRELYAIVGREFHMPAWSWRKALRKFRRRPRRVELAIWAEGQLCGLALGRVSDRCIVSTIHLLEGNPADTPLDGKIIAIATRFLDLFALGLGCRDASIESPVPELIERYKQQGFVKEVTKGKKVLRLKKSIPQG